MEAIGAVEVHVECMVRAIGGLAVDSFFFFSSRRRHTRFDCDWSSDVCSSDLGLSNVVAIAAAGVFNLALRSDGSVVAWGGASQALLPRDLTNVIAIAAGEDHGDRKSVV